MGMWIKNPILELSSCVYQHKRIRKFVICNEESDSSSGAFDPLTTFPFLFQFFDFPYCEWEIMS